VCDAGQVIHRVFTAKIGDLFFARMKGLALAMTVRIILIITVTFMIGPSLAYGSSACMTESQARAKFPKAHLIWLGTDHCWTFGAVHSPRPALGTVPAPEPRPKFVSRGTDAGTQCQYSPCE
jgi:hypothetical protein